MTERLEVPSQRAERYDRQLRLWGDHGQSLLESSHICLINATATGTEILKNLVLPGIGAFTIIGSGLVSLSDLGVNFFMSHEDINKSKSQVAVRYLKEMNSEVKGYFIDENFEVLLDLDPKFFSKFAVVVACDLHEKSLLKLSSVLWQFSIPLLVVKSYGLIGYLRISTPSHEILEARPDNFHADLRLDVTFSELSQYMDAIDLAALYSKQAGNIPYLVVLYKMLDKWKGSGKTFPSQYKEKKNFKNFVVEEISKMTANPPEENLEEAVKNINSQLTASTVPDNVLSVFNDQKCSNIGPESSDFWVLARAVREFVHREGAGNLPVRGTIPDMISSTELYIQLQQVYVSRANKDMEIVSAYVEELLGSTGRPKGSIEKNDIKNFCKNSAFISVKKYHSIADEYVNPEVNDVRFLLDDPSSEGLYYVLLRVAEKYYELYQCYPGSKDDGFDNDVAQIKAFAIDFCNTHNLPSRVISDDHVTEFCRYGGTEVHSIAAFLGGVAAQEVIKLVTHQYVPINNTMIYHGMSCKSVVFNI